MATKKPKRIVLVTWVDSCSRGGWTFPDEVKKWTREPMTIHSVGFMLKEGKDAITIHQGYDDQRRPNVNGLFQIPRGAIRKIKTIAVREK
jgi:hypothetical protein